MTNAVDPLLSVLGLTRRFDATGAAAVCGVSFDVAPGEVVALLGPSGCGKTTTLRMIGGFETPDAGIVRLGGRDVTALPPEQRGIGLVFQDYALFPHLDALENVRFGLRGLSRAEGRARARAMLDLVGMGALAGRRPHQLSGGQQQRVALARTLAPGPKLALLDEPFSGLDATLRVETRQEVRDLLRRAGAAAIIVTHDQEEALALADRIAVMQTGRLIQIGAPQTVHGAPECAFVAGFIGRATLLPGCGLGDRAESPLGVLTLSRKATGPLTLALRPEQLRLSPGAGPDAAVIRAREFRGHDQLYWIDDGAHLLTAICGGDQSFAVGDPVSLEVVGPVAVLPAR